MKSKRNILLTKVEYFIASVVIDKKIFWEIW